MGIILEEKMILKNKEAVLIYSIPTTLSVYRLSVCLSKDSATNYWVAVGIKYPAQEIKQQSHLIGPPCIIHEARLCDDFGIH